MSRAFSYPNEVMLSPIQVQDLIREAIERGEFTGLKGEGKPIDLDAYFATPADIRLAYSVLKSNDYVPEEVSMLNEVAELRARVAAEPDDTTAATLKQRLQERELALRLAIERNKRRA